MNLAVAWAPSTPCPGGWSGFADLLKQGAAAASTFFAAHSKPLCTGFQLTSATAVQCQQVTASASCINLRLSPGRHEQSTGRQAQSNSLPASLKAFAAGSILRHSLDVASPDQSSMDQILSLRPPTAESHSSDDPFPDVAALYAVTEGIRASSLSLQPHSICKAAVDFADLLPQLQQLTADAQPLAFDQLLRSLEPVVTDLLSWHQRLHPAIQQHCSRLTGLQETHCADDQLTAALSVDLMSLYVASLAEMLRACSQLPHPPDRAMQLLSDPLLAWVQQLFHTLVSLARSAVAQLEANLNCSASDRHLVQELLSLGLPLDQVR